MDSLDERGELMLVGTMIVLSDYSLAVMLCMAFAAGAAAVLIGRG